MLKKLRLFGIIAAISGLSGFYLYTLYLAANPQVSLSYRLFYMDQKTKYWEFNSDMVYHLGSKIDLTKMSRFLSTEGFGAEKPTAEGTVFEGEGGIYFALEKPISQNIQAVFTLSSQTQDNNLLIKVGTDWSQQVALKKGANKVEVIFPGTLLKSGEGVDNLNFISLKSTDSLNMQSFRFEPQAQ